MASVGSERPEYIISTTGRAPFKNKRRPMSGTTLLDATLRGRKGKSLEHLKCDQLPCDCSCFREKGGMHGLSQSKESGRSMAPRGKKPETINRGSYTQVIGGLVKLAV